jgi:hypothetical protein
MIAFMEFLYTGTCWRGKDVVSGLAIIAKVSNIKHLKVLTDSHQQGEFKTVVPPDPAFGNGTYSAW